MLIITKTENLTENPKKLSTLLTIQFSLGAVVMPLNKVENVAIFSDDFQNMCQ